MDADIEHLVLSGKLFGTASRSSSPERSPSPSLSFVSADSNDEKHGVLSDAAAVHESIGMGPGRTGVKGVIRDQHEAQAMQAAKREKEMEALRRRMERGNLGGKTFLEEEREKRLLEGWDELQDELGSGLRRRRRTFGHLREVGRAGFVAAVEREDRGVWVVVHLYESSLDRCYELDDTLARLARLYPQTKFLRARAAALGFASTGSSSRRNPYSDDATDEKTPYYDEEEDCEEEDVDTDMLPTVLVYRDERTPGRAGVEELLASFSPPEGPSVSRHIIGAATAASGDGNCGLPSDGEDDLIWSDEEDAAS
ncbi:hypothetical protein BU15DRAFT_89765 [Melanogaster broomeanus]|nr:hypothetical protein BU15DRAFT_89765 [Melanogaster broomeanus]